jgi:amino acid transporter
MCAVIVLETLTASASIGPSGIFWWFVAFVFFVIPYAFITSELGTTYPAEGGIYVWIRRAFGARMGTRAIYLYWLAGGLWMPAGYILFSGVFSRVFFPAMTLNWQIAVTLIMTWVTVTFINYKVKLGIEVTIAGAIFKSTVILILAAAGIYHVMVHGLANPFNASTMLPSANVGVGFLSVIVYNLVGFELVACLGKELKNPAKDMPKSILYSSIFIGALYIIGSMGILAAVPLSQLNLVSGIVDALYTILGKNNPLVYLVCVFYMISIVGNQATWAMAPSMATAVAAQEGELPKFLGKIHPKHHTPYWANRTLGIVSTVVTILYAWFAHGNNSDLFWSIFSFSSAVIIISYLLYFAAFIKLRISDPNAVRPFKVPGGMWGAWVATLLCLFAIAASATLFVFPDAPKGSINWHYSSPIFIGVIVVILIGEVIIRHSERATSRRPSVQLEPVGEETL